MNMNRGRPKGSGKADSPALSQFEEQVRKEIRVLLAEKDLSQKQIAWQLDKMGIKETAKGLSAKLNAGSFSAAFYLALKEAINRL